MQVCTASSLSRRYEVENGTSQGSVISIMLFYSMIDNVLSKVSPETGKSVFADDGALCRYSESAVGHFNHHLFQQCL